MGLGRQGRCEETGVCDGSKPAAADAAAANSYALSIASGCTKLCILPKADKRPALSILLCISDVRSRGYAGGRKGASETLLVSRWLTFVDGEEREGEEDEPEGDAQEEEEEEEQGKLNLLPLLADSP